MKGIKKMKEKIMKLKNAFLDTFQENKKDLVKQGIFFAFMFGVFSLVGVNSFAQQSETAVITTEMLNPIVTSISKNLGVILPVGMGIMGTFIGVKLIPKIIYKFL